MSRAWEMTARTWFCGVTATIAVAVNLHAAPTLRALWLANEQNTNSVKPAIDMLSKRIGIPIAFERRDITPFEASAEISEAEMKALRTINPDFVVMSFGENVTCKTIPSW